MLTTQRVSGILRKAGFSGAQVRKASRDRVAGVTQPGFRLRGSLPGVVIVSWQTRQPEQERAYLAEMAATLDRAGLRVERSAYHLRVTEDHEARAAAVLDAVTPSAEMD